MARNENFPAGSDINLWSGFSRGPDATGTKTDLLVELGLVMACRPLGLTISRALFTPVSRGVIHRRAAYFRSSYWL